MESDNKKIVDIELNEEEQQRANNIFQTWKENNRRLENQIEAFMANKKDHIQEIMDRSDKLQSRDGIVRAVELTKPGVGQENEEIRLLKEQNELLKQLLAQKLS